MTNGLIIHRKDFRGIIRFNNVTKAFKVAFGKKKRSNSSSSVRRHVLTY